MNLTLAGLLLCVKQCFIKIYSHVTHGSGSQVIMSGLSSMSKNAVVLSGMSFTVVVLSIMSCTAVVLSSKSYSAVS